MRSFIKNNLVKSVTSNLLIFVKKCMPGAIGTMLFNKSGLINLVARKG